MSDATVTDPPPSSVDVDALFPKPAGWRAWTLRSVFGRTIAERLTLALITGMAMFVFGVWMGPLFTSMEDSLTDITDNFGEAFVDIFGDFATPAGWLNAELYSLMVPAALVYVAVSSAAMAFAQEQEDKSIGLLAANPVGRPSIGVEKAAGTFVHVSIVSVLSGLGTWLGVVLGSLDLPASHVAAITAHLLLFGAVVATTAMCFAVVLGRRVQSMVATAVLVVVAYAWGTFAPLSDSLDAFAALSPWYWYLGTDPLTNGAHVGYLALSAGLAMLLGAVAIRRFDQRDLPG